MFNLFGNRADNDVGKYRTGKPMVGQDGGKGRPYVSVALLNSILARAGFRNCTQRGYEALALCLEKDAEKLCSHLKDLRRTDAGGAKDYTFGKKGHLTGLANKYGILENHASWEGGNLYSNQVVGKRYLISLPGIKKPGRERGPSFNIKRGSDGSGSLFNIKRGSDGSGSLFKINSTRERGPSFNISRRRNEKGPSFLLNGPGSDSEASDEEYDFSGEYVKSRNEVDELLNGLASNDPRYMPLPGDDDDDWDDMTDASSTGIARAVRAGLKRHAASGIGLPATTDEAGLLAELAKSKADGQEALVQVKNLKAELEKARKGIVEQEKQTRIAKQKFDKAYGVLKRTAPKLMAGADIYNLDAFADKTLEIHQGNLAMASKEIARLNADADAVRRDLRVADAEIAAQKIYLERSQQAVRNAEEKLAREIHHVSGNSTEVTQQQQQWIAQLEEALAQAVTKLQEVHQEALNSAAEGEMHLERLDVMEEQLLNYGNENAALRMTKEQLAQEGQRLQEELAAARAYAGDSGGQAAALQTQLQAVNALLQTERTTHQITTGKLSAAMNTIGELKVQVASLAAKNEAMAATIERGNETLRKLEENVANLQAENGALLAQRDAVRSLLDDMITYLGQLFEVATNQALGSDDDRNNPGSGGSRQALTVFLNNIAEQKNQIQSSVHVYRVKAEQRDGLWALMEAKGKDVVRLTGELRETQRKLAVQTEAARRVPGSGTIDSKELLRQYKADADKQLNKANEAGEQLLREKQTVFELETKLQRVVADAQGHGLRYNAEMENAGRQLQAAQQKVAELENIQQQLLANLAQQGTQANGALAESSQERERLTHQVAGLVSEVQALNGQLQEALAGREELQRTYQQSESKTGSSQAELAAARKVVTLFNTMRQRLGQMGVLVDQGDGEYVADALQKIQSSAKAEAALKAQVSRLEGELQTSVANTNALAQKNQELLNRMETMSRESLNDVKKIQYLEDSLKASQQAYQEEYSEFESGFDEPLLVKRKRMAKSMTDKEVVVYQKYISELESINTSKQSVTELSQGLVDVMLRSIKEQVGDSVGVPTKALNAVQRARKNRMVDREFEKKNQRAYNTKQSGIASRVVPTSDRWGSMTAETKAELARLEDPTEEFYERMQYTDNPFDGRMELDV